MSNALSIHGHTSTCKPPVSTKPLPTSGSNTIDPSRPLEKIDANRTAGCDYGDEVELGGPAHIRDRIAADNRKAEDAFAARWNLTASKKK